MTIRLLEPTDSLVELTELVHRAYASLGELGLNYTAVDQPVSVTRERIGEGECWVVEDEDGALVATCLLSFPFPTFENNYLSEDGHAYINQFAVEPTMQGHGIGSRLLDRIEQRAREEGCPDIGLDTAMPAAHLIAYYAKRGYEIVEEVQWADKTYRSVIMSKRL